VFCPPKNMSSIAIDPMTVAGAMTAPAAKPPTPLVSGASAAIRIVPAVAAEMP
jgi:hypothetical protein